MSARSGLGKTRTRLSALLLLRLRRAASFANAFESSTLKLDAEDAKVRAEGAEKRPQNAAASESFLDAAGKGFHHLLCLARRGAIRRHEDNDISNRTSQHAASGHGIADANPGTFAQVKRLACAPIFDQLYTCDESDLTDVARLRQ